MINGMILHEYENRYNQLNNDSFIIEMVMENFNMESTIFNYSIIQEADKGNIFIRIKDFIVRQFNRLIEWIKSFFNKKKKVVEEKVKEVVKDMKEKQEETKAEHKWDKEGAVDVDYEEENDDKEDEPEEPKDNETPEEKADREKREQERKEKERLRREKDIQRHKEVKERKAKIHAERTAKFNKEQEEKHNRESAAKEFDELGLKSMYLYSLTATPGLFEWYINGFEQIIRKDKQNKHAEQDKKEMIEDLNNDNIKNDIIKQAIIDDLTYDVYINGSFDDILNIMGRRINYYQMSNTKINIFLSYNTDNSRFISAVEKAKNEFSSLIDKVSKNPDDYANSEFVAKYAQIYLKEITDITTKVLVRYTQLGEFKIKHNMEIFKKYCEINKKYNINTK